MGGKGGDPYRSDYLDEGDQLAWQTAQGMLSGQAVSPSPAMTGSYVAQSIGGKYDPNTLTVTAPDGTKLKYDPNTGQYSAGDSEGNWSQYYKSDGTKFSSSQDAQSYISSGGQLMSQGSRGGLTPADPSKLSFDSGSSSPYVNQANQIAGQFSSEVYDNPDSAWNLYASLGDSAKYNPTTGAYETGTAGADQNLNADYYFGKYGDPFSQEYKAFDYQSPTIGSVDNISDAARMNLYQRGADKIATNFRDQAQQTEDWLSSQKGSLSSGRALALKNKDMENKNRSLQELQSDVDTQHEMRNYQDAINKRNMQADYDFKSQAQRGDESRYGQDWQRDQGKQKLGFAEGLDSAQRDRAFQELQANRQQKLNQYGGLTDLMRIWSGLEGNWTNAQAAQSQAVGSALGGLFGGAGAIGGGFAGK